MKRKGATDLCRGKREKKNGEIRSGEHWRRGDGKGKHQTRTTNPKSIELGEKTKTGLGREAKKSSSREEIKEWQTENRWAGGRGPRLQALEAR